MTSREKCSAAAVNTFCAGSIKLSIYIHNTVEHRAHCLVNRDRHNLVPFLLQYLSRVSRDSVLDF